jgi:uncharacterized membrane protein
VDNLDRKLKALEWFKDWSNYLLITTVAATGWVASGSNISWPPWLPWLKTACIWSLGVSVVFGILTLALIPLVAQQIKESDESIYRVRARFSVLGFSREAYLTQACRPQHVSFMAGIVFYCLGATGANRAGIVVVAMTILYGIISKPKEDRVVKAKEEERNA